MYKRMIIEAIKAQKQLYISDSSNFIASVVLFYVQIIEERGYM